jgi:fatty-acid peroxygenase
MRTIPSDGHIDSSLALLADPYRYIARECRRRRTDILETRLLLEPTLCLTGPIAAELFYDTERFTREAAAPEPLRATLFGEGGVQALDGGAHRHRKAMFMALMTPESIRALTQRVVLGWDIASVRWSASQAEVALYDAMHELLTRAVCEWAGVPLREAEVAERTHDLVALFDEAGAKGLGHVRARMARRRAEQWMETLIGQARMGELDLDREGAAWRVAMHRDLDGQPLDARVAAVELLNVLRPTVAVSVYVVQAAHALHAHPALRAALQGGDEGALRRFVLEVRRCYPFFPAVMARVRKDFEWEGFPFRQGTRVVLDIYGTNHDPRTWEAPDEFRPDRFIGREPTSFDMIPQGGGEHHGNHRCPGEWITEAVLQASVDYLARRIAYDVPPQALEIDYARLPAIPKDRFRIRNVRRLV